MKKIIYIGGIARSGTSWIGQIFNSSPDVVFRFQPMFSYEFRGRINEDSSAMAYQNFYDELVETDTDFLNQRDKVEDGVYPVFLKNNPSILAFKENRFQSFIEPMLRKCPNLVFVGVIRNPNAALYSWSQNSREFPEGSEILKEWRFANCKNKSNEDYYGFYKWKEVANLYLDLKIKYGERVHIIHYDKFVQNAIASVQNMFTQLKLEYHEQTDHFLSESSRRADNHYYSVFRGKSNKSLWKTNLPSHIINEIRADLKDTRLALFNTEF